MQQDSTECNEDRIRVRRAETCDLELVAPLFDSYRQFYRQESDLHAAHRFIAERFAAQDSVIFLATQAETAAGFAQLYPSYSSVAMNRLWVLNDLFVAADFRRQGVAKKLVHAATEFARESSASRLVLATEVDNSTAKHLYERCGWQIDQAFDHYYFTLS